jgi:hypothetical protein
MWPQEPGNKQLISQPAGPGMGISSAMKECLHRPSQKPEIGSCPEQCKIQSFGIFSVMPEGILRRSIRRSAISRE